MGTGLTDLTLPRLGETMTEGRIVGWLKRPGAVVMRGETLLEVETDKTVVEVPALTGGTLAEILAEAGATVAVGAVIGRLRAEGIGQAPVASAPAEAAPGPGPATPPPAPPPSTPPASGPGSGTAGSADGTGGPSGAAFLLPRLGETMEEGRIGSWIAAPGHRFRRGEVLLEVETDKTIVEVPALEDGVLLEIVAPTGSLVAVGMPIARIARSAAAVVPSRPGEPAPAAGEPGPPRPPGQVAGAALHAMPLPGLPAAPAAWAARSAGGAARPGLAGGGDPGERPRASPVARRLARAAGVDLERIEGTGRRGRVTGADVRGATAAGPGPAGVRPAAPGTGGAPVLAGVGGVLPGPATAGPAASPPAASGAAAAALACRWHLPQGEARPVPVVLLHGLFGDGDGFVALTRALTGLGRRVLTIDLPGHGESGPAGGDPPGGISGALAAIQATLAAEAPGPVRLVGHSLGAILATRIALARQAGPERRSATAAPSGGVESLVLLAPAGLGIAIAQEFPDTMLAAETPAALRRGLDLLGAGPLSDGLVTALLARIRAARPALAALARDLSAGGVQQQDIAPDLARLGIPVRAVFGLADRIIPWTQATALPAAVSVHFLKGGGHLPQADDPGLIARLIDA